MKIVNQEAIYLPHDNELPYDFIEDVGRTCYKSDKRGNPIGFVKGLAKSGHLAMLEHEYVYFRLNETAMKEFKQILESWESKYLTSQKDMYLVHLEHSLNCF